MFFCCHVLPQNHFVHLQLRWICPLKVGNVCVIVLIGEILIVDGIRRACDRFFSHFKLWCCYRHRAGFWILYNISFQGLGSNLLWRCNLLPTFKSLDSFRKHATKLYKDPGRRANAFSLIFFPQWCLENRSLVAGTVANLREARDTIWSHAVIRFSLPQFNKNCESPEVTLSCPERVKMFFPGGCISKAYLLSTPNLMNAEHSFCISFREGLSRKSLCTW